MEKRIHTTKPQIKVGDVFKTNCYGDVEVIEYLGANKIKVKFKADGYERYSTSGNLQKGKVKNPTIPTITHTKRLTKSVSIGEVFKNTDGFSYWITDYFDASNVKVEFESGYTTNCTLQRVRNGVISDNFSPSRFSGYLGTLVGIDEKNVAKTKEYTHWSSMLARCSCEDYHSKYPTYKGTTVCEEWLNFTVFAKWCREQPEFLLGHRVFLDKDILNKGNKHYSPDTCTFVPHDVNTLFTKADASRGEYPIGVSFCTTRNVITACVRIDKRTKYLGRFENPFDAFCAYKKAKEAYIKELAEKFKPIISHNCYLAMYKYRVEITD
jgi:hypothetical protein